MEPILKFAAIDERGPQEATLSLGMTTEFLDRPEVENVGDVKLHYRAQRGSMPGEYVVDGDLDYVLDLRCSRCLEPSPFANSASFTVRYRPRPAGALVENEEVEIGEEDLELEYYTDPSVALPELAAEQIQLSLPMKPLCTAGCLGLCPTCGANRNRGACACGETESDERWGALRGLRDQLAKKNEV
jgi:Predicted metal-binding, possibly nucleic acid-binding protein